MSDANSFCRTALLALVASAALVASTDARAGGCKPNGQQCPTNMSCCSRNCVKPTVKHGSALFGVCCPTGARLVGGQCCVPNCTNKQCGDDGCGGSCGTCAMSECDTTTSMCVACIPDGDQGCRSDFDCCSGVCGADTVCESTTTTTTATTSTSTTSSTSTTTLPFCGPEGVLIACTCGDGQTSCANNSTTDCTGPTPSCASHQASCVSFCAPFGGPGTCGTAPCIDCTTEQPCQDALTTTTTTSSTTTTTMAGISFQCPPADLAGRPLLDQSTSSGTLFCRYQVIPNDFFCNYFSDTGLLKQDHDDGFCPPVAEPSAT